MKTRIIRDIGAIAADEWEPVAGRENPFLDHRFLMALQASGSVGADSGWDPCFVTIWDGDELVAAAPLYEKDHSYGEYIFDWGWADAYHRHGVPYYPKLVVATPFTPATTPKLLARNAKARAALIEVVRDFARDYASLHWLFLPEDERDCLAQNGHFARASYQFHWHNRDYSDFEAFLAALKQRRRKEIRRERRQLTHLRISTLTGDELDASHAALMDLVYRRTCAAKFASPYLEPGFFAEVIARMPERIVMHIAEDAAGPCAAAINFRGDNALYGRYWGCLREHRFLHFELCLYRGIDFAIREGLALFEAGAQGQHKISRGFSPVVTHSAHFIRDPRFAAAIQAFVADEASSIEGAILGNDDCYAYRAS